AAKRSFSLFALSAFSAFCLAIKISFLLLSSACLACSSFLLFSAQASHTQPVFTTAFASAGLCQYLQLAHFMLCACAYVWLHNAVIINNINATLTFSIIFVAFIPKINYWLMFLTKVILIYLT